MTMRRCARSSPSCASEFSRVRTLAASPPRRPKIRVPRPMAEIWAGAVLAPSCLNSTRRSPTSNPMRSASPSRLAMVGTSCRCWAREPMTAPTMCGGKKHLPRCARAKSTKSQRCSCVVCATTPSSKPRCRRAQAVYIPRIVITSGEPAGVGPDACVSLAQRDWEADLVVAADAELLAATAEALSLPLTLERYDPTRSPKPHRNGTLQVMHIPTNCPVVPGHPDVRNAAYVIEMLDRACDGCTNGEFAAMVTAPVQKSTLMDAGYAFSGHTEYLAERTRAALPVMLLVNDRLRVALVTTHLPLADVSRAITKERLRATLRIVNMDLERHFSLAPPRIAVLGLNPHAGEAGHLGREELDIIEPVIRELQDEGLNLQGPIPADTAFTKRFLKTIDVIVAMYHDQGLPVIKHVGFGNAVNMTLGLPILRTSVDHGTALKLARSGKADTGSLSAAVALAIVLATPRSDHAGS